MEGTPLLTMEKSRSLLLNLLDEGLFNREALKAQGVRHTTLRAHFQRERRKRIRRAGEGLEYCREKSACAASVINYYLYRKQDGIGLGCFLIWMGLASTWLTWPGVAS